MAQSDHKGQRDPHSKRQVLVTGAAGYIGKPFTEHMAERGEHIIAFYRNRLPAAHANVLPLCCEMRTIESMLSPLRGVEQVVHLAWQGGVLGSTGLRMGRASDAQIQLGENVIMTQNLVRAMERAGTRRIIFFSWMGASRRADKLLLREKYWAESIILNSNIPEKIIVRSGIIIAPEMAQSEFAKAASFLSRLPVVLPVSRRYKEILFTTMKDVVSTIDGILRQPAGDGARLIELASTAPQTCESVLTAMDNKWWNGKRLKVGGFIGDNLYKWTESNFGRIEAGNPRLSDFLSVSSRAFPILPDLRVKDDRHAASNLKDVL